MNIIRTSGISGIGTTWHAAAKQLCAILSKTVLRKIYVISLSRSLRNYWLLLQL